MAEVSKADDGSHERKTIVNRKATTANKNVSNYDVFENVTDQLFHEVEKVYKETGKVSDDVLSALNCVFQAPLLPALDLVDKHSVSLLTCPAGRQLFQVIGSTGTPYTCFSSSNYCSCPAYRFLVLKKEDHVMCKHVLCIRLSKALGKYKTLTISDQEMTNLMSQIT